MIDTFTPDRAAAWLSSRLHDARHELETRWRAAFPARDLPVADLIASIAEYLRLSPTVHIGSNDIMMRRAAELGRQRFVERSTVHQLLREFQLFADIIEEFLLDQVQKAEPALAAAEVLRAMHRVTQSVRAIQQQTVNAFVQRYTDTIERQSGQLISFARLVGHEMRQPLGVLQLMPGVVPIREGDHELTHLMDVFERNIRRLADVAARLERLSHDSVEATLMSIEQAIDLGEMVAAAVEKLHDLARAHDVRVQFGADLPTLLVDPSTTERVFANLIENGIKYSDPTKQARLVEVLAVQGQSEPTVIVRDNGIGMPARLVQHLFREFTRAHGYRDRDFTHQGLGVGLSMVRDAMDACGGTVLLQSSEGAGTTVTLSWPEWTRPAAR